MSKCSFSLSVSGHSVSEAAAACSTDSNMKLAAQAGATDLVGPYPGTELSALIDYRDRAAKNGLKLTTLERLWPHDKIVHNKPGTHRAVREYQRGCLENPQFY